MHHVCSLFNLQPSTQVIAWQMQHPSLAELMTAGTSGKVWIAADAPGAVLCAAGALGTVLTDVLDSCLLYKWQL